MIGANSTATNQETIRQMPTTAKIEKVYSPAELLAKPIGTKPAMVTSVPISIGKASVRKAKAAELSIVSPTASRFIMASTVLMASSTIRPSAMMIAPSEIRCKSMSTSSMIGNSRASVSGTESATTAPARKPRLMMLTPMMMAIDCHSDSMNSPTAWRTVTGWSATRVASMPIGRSAVIAAISCLMFWPSRRMSPPSRMAMASPIAGLPSTRNIGCGGSAWPRRTSAMSPSRSTRPPATKFTASTSCSVRNAPETRSDSDSSPVWMVPVGATMFCACSAAIRALRSMPRPASVSVENSTNIFSSCAPRISIFDTSGTSSSFDLMSSTLSRNCRWVKPSAVNP